MLVIEWNKLSWTELILSVFTARIKDPSLLFYPTVFYRTLYNLASLAFYAKYRKIPKVSALRFRMYQAAAVLLPLFTGSRYFRTVKRRLYGNNRCRQSGRVTHESKSSVCAYKQKRP